MRTYKNKGNMQKATALNEKQESIPSDNICVQLSDAHISREVSTTFIGNLQMMANAPMGVDSGNASSFVRLTEQKNYTLVIIFVWGNNHLYRECSEGEAILS
jgi:hypothetical protein